MLTSLINSVAHCCTNNPVYSGDNCKYFFLFRLQGCIALCIPKTIRKLVPERSRQFGKTKLNKKKLFLSKFRMCSCVSLMSIAYHTRRTMTTRIMKMEMNKKYGKDGEKGNDEEDRM